MSGSIKDAGEQLVERARKGDTAAFATLYESVYVDLYRFALGMMKNPQEAEDVVSESVVSAFEHVEQLKEAKAFRGWMFTIVSRNCKRQLSKTNRYEQELSIDGEMPAGNTQSLGIVTEPDLAENYDLHMAMNRLTGEERLIILMITLGGYSSREVGEILELNAATVRSKQSRALEKLRGLLYGDLKSEDGKEVRSNE